MATITYGNTASDQSNLPLGFNVADFNSLTLASETPSLAQGDYRLIGRPNVAVTFQGSDFTYDANRYPTGGTVTGYEETVDGALAVRIEGISIPVTSLETWANNNDNASAVSAIFSGNDTITGSSGNDVLQGYGGDDLILGSGGTDTAAFSGSLSSYSFVNLDPNILLVSDGTSTTSLHDISSLRFADQTVSAAAVPLSSAVAGTDTTSGQPLSVGASAYAGPVSGLLAQYINITSDNLSLAAAVNNVFLRTGSGTDAIAVRGGSNVLDGGTGSNFLTGGSGTDTFFVDDRGAGAATWSTMVGFHQGDAATVYGVSPADFAINWSDNEGTAGFTGLTLHASAPNRPTASLTLPGFSQADLTNGRLSVTYGTDTASSSNYMYITANR